VLAFRLGELSSHCVPNLKIYLTVILQFTTLSLLFSLSSSAFGVLPAIMASDAPSVDSKTVIATEVETPIVAVTAEVKKTEDYEPMTDSKNVKSFVEKYFADIPIMIEVARCESRNRQFTPTGDIIRGEVNKFDVGVMQINEMYHLEDSRKLGYDIYTIEGNTAYARYLYERQGAKPWLSSSPCWAKFSESSLAQK
jgi:hypothetical protein